MIIVSGDNAYGGKSVLDHLPDNVHIISHVHQKEVLYEPAGQLEPNSKTKGRPRKTWAQLPGLAASSENPNQPWTCLKFDQFGFRAFLSVKTRQALLYKTGGDRMPRIGLVRAKVGRRLDQRFYSTRLDWDTRQIFSS